MKNSYQVFPNASQAFILKMLLDRNSVLETFEQWRVIAGNQDSWDSATLRLIPILYSRLQSWGVPSKELLFLKNVYQMHWMLSQRSLIHAKQIISFFNIHSITSLVAKGLPLAVNYYEKPFHRPIGDVDILIHREDVKKTYELLRSNGWVCIDDGGGKKSLSTLLAGANSLTFNHELFGKLDLHWKLFHDCAKKNVNDQLWNRAIDFSWEGESCLRLSNEDMLIHTLLHGMRGSAESSIRWIMDAAMIIQKDGALLDWNYIVGFTQENQVTLRILWALEYLRIQYDLGAPIWVLSALKKIHIDAFERWEARVLLSDPKLFSAGVGRLERRYLRLWQLWRRSDKQDMIVAILAKILPASLFKKYEF
ncbi:Uncharacterised nucleotidyltransferase [Burkholderiaceae bacterium]